MTAEPAEAASIKLDDFHLHELLDRAWLLCEMFDTAITNHPAARLLHAEIDAVAGHLGDLYQKIGSLHCARISPTDRAGDGQA